ncbi:DUF3226 domain-containing protein [Larkinella sp.]|uniref:DUF3226 domain-containing protein n=1 Tax=Larkinella sp. TaxID=2034517 RepID=UPI003BACA6AF
MSTYKNRSRWTKKLLVEGNDDLHVIANIRDRYQLPDNFEIVDCKGVDNIADKLLSLIKNRQDVIGVVVDADDQLDSRWQSLRHFMLEQGYAVPEHVRRDGTIIPASGRNPRIGVWLMPDNLQQPGMLEHFVASLIPPDDGLILEASRILTELEVSNLNKYKSIHKSKALIYTWLAWQESPGTPMGLAITKTYLTHNSDLCQRFITWLDTLFNFE